MLTLILIAVAILLLIVVVFLVMRRSAGANLADFTGKKMPRKPIVPVNVEGTLLMSAGEMSKWVSNNGYYRMQLDTDGVLSTYTGTRQIWKDYGKLLKGRNWRLLIDGNNMLKIVGDNLIEGGSPILRWEIGAGRPGYSTLILKDNGSLVQRVNGEMFWSTIDVSKDDWLNPNAGKMVWSTPRA